MTAKQTTTPYDEAAAELDKFIDSHMPYDCGGDGQREAMIRARDLLWSMQSEMKPSDDDVLDAQRYRKLRDELCRGDRAAGYMPESLRLVSHPMDFDAAVDEGWQ